jgi:uncharacterized spore protein YtfJ
MDVKEILEQARDTMTARRVFGEPIERDGLVVIPVASVRGGAGAGTGDREGGAEGGKDHGARGAGGGWGADARPAGVFVISGENVSWQPAVDLNRIVLGGQVAFAIGLIVAGLVVRDRLRRRR